MQLNNDNYGTRFGLYNGCVAYEDFYKKTFFVFKDVSPKRLKVRNVLSKWCHYKVQYVSNAQLLEMDYFEDVKAVVFGGKLGTRYSTHCSSGSYFFCKRKGGPEPTPRLKRSH
jgi:hypothetical protein